MEPAVLDADALVAAARTATGLDDLGDDSWREGLDRLVWSLVHEADLGEVGAVVAPAMIQVLLEQRLQVEDWYARHPEIDDEPVERPLIGLGLPRTGSTALSYLLAQDPRSRSLLRWEAPQPCPPPSTVPAPDPRIAEAEATVAATVATSPRSAALLPTSATGPSECQDLMGLDFRAHYFQAWAHVPSYSRWLLHDADLRSTYTYERRVLKLLQWGQPRRPWRLKCPSHLLWLDALDTAFPDARFVWTHRDPTEVMVSVADVYEEVGALFGAQIDPAYYGPLNVEHWTVGMARALAFRERGDHDERFFDIDFRAMQEDPIGQVRRLYDWLGEPVTPAFEEGMQRWWTENSATRAPNVHPDPARYGLDLDAVRPQFADYVARARAWTA